MSESATPVLDRPQVLSAESPIVFEGETDMEHEPVCEARPNGKRCFRVAAVSAVVTSHGCRRDGKTILLCRMCYDAISGGSLCAECNAESPIFIVRAVML